MDLFEHITTVITAVAKLPWWALVMLILGVLAGLWIWRTTTPEPPCQVVINNTTYNVHGTPPGDPLPPTQGPAPTAAGRGPPGR